MSPSLLAAMLNARYTELSKQRQKNSLEDVLGKKEEVVQLVNIEKKESVFKKIKKWIKNFFIK